MRSALCLPLLLLLLIPAGCAPAAPPDLAALCVPSALVIPPTLHATPGTGYRTGRRDRT